MIDAEHVRLSLVIKPIYSRTRGALRALADGDCAEEPDEPCAITVWRETYAIADLIGRWTHVAMRIKSDQKDGELEFWFDRQRRMFLAGSRTLHAPTAVNACAHAVHLGVYALGYDRALFGTPDERAANGAAWTAQPFREIYGAFIEGTQAPGQSPPRIMVDFDNFVIR